MPPLQELKDCKSTPRQEEYTFKCLQLFPYSPVVCLSLSNDEPLFKNHFLSRAGVFCVCVCVD